MVEKKRIGWIDAVRGIGILLVILGHMELPLPLYVVIYAIHMPIFFVITGYLYNPEQPILETLKSRFRGLIIPYYGFLLAMLLLLHIDNGYWSFLLLKEQFRTTSGFWYALWGYTPFIEPTWFLVCLFCTMSILAMAVKLVNNRIALLWGCLGGFLLLAHIWATLHWVALPLRMHLVPMGITFCIAGMMLRKYEAWQQWSLLKKAMWALLLSAAFIILACGHGQRDMNSNNIGCSAIYWLIGSLGTFSLFLGSCAIEQMNRWVIIPFVFLGKRSLYILAYHQWAARGVRELLGHDGRINAWCIRILIFCVMLFFVEATYRLVSLSKTKILSSRNKLPA